MMALKNIDMAFLPMNVPYTMSPSEAAECARAFKPRIVYPYHYFESDPKVFAADRPFLFVVRDSASGSLLLVGRVEQP